MSLLKIDLWFDLVCPWSRMALSELQKALAENGDEVEVHLHAYRIDPDALPAYAESTIEHLMAKLEISREQAHEMLANVVQRGRDFGLDFNFENARGGNTLTGHRLVKLAAESGQQFQVALELFKAHFELGFVPTDDAMLKDVAMRAGISEARFASFIDSAEFRAEVDADEAKAKELGISSRPFFIFNDNERVAGVISKSDLLARLS